MFAFRLSNRSKTDFVVIAVFVSVLVVALLARKPDRANASARIAPTCGQTITVSTTLTSDLTNCPAWGLIVGHDSITLNLNGHTIDGVGTAGGYAGVFVDSHKSVIVQGGTVQQFYYGVYVNGTKNTIKSLRVTGTVNGIQMSIGTGNTITLNNAYSNSGYGVVVSPAGTMVTNNTFANNATGLYLAPDAQSNVVTGNHALNNSGNGILIDTAATGGTLTSNVANGNGIDGIRSASALATFTTNTANYNGQLGINAAPGSTDGNGNKGHDNGAAKQCVNLVCP